MTAEEVIAALGLGPHPEGGWFRETYRHAPREGGRGAGTANAWQAARSLGDWTLVGCTVTPAFEFASFEMAPAGWEPD
jgi:predicted cupin superfamily sugar epimerase